MKTVIRSSSLPGYTDCPRRWAAGALGRELEDAGFLVVKGLRKSVGASVGTATHSGAAFMMSEKIASGSLGNQTEAEQRALEDFTDASREGVLWDDATPNLNDAQKQIQRMVRTFRFTLAPIISPVAVERRLEADVGDGFLLSGQSDLQVIEPDWIRDLKTGKTPRTHYAQLGSYSLLARTVHPHQMVKGVCTDFIQRVPLKSPQPEPVTEHYNQVVAEQAAVSTINRIKDDVREFRRRAAIGDAPPEHAFLANPGSMLCSPKYCPAHGSSFCREHKQTK